MMRKVLFMYRRKKSRWRRFRRRMPLYAFLTAILAFGMALTFPPEETAEPVRTLPVQSMAAAAGLDTLPPLESHGIEPDIPASPAGQEDWMLTLVNPWNPLPEDYTFQLKRLSSGHQVDERCYPDLQDMMDACRNAGLSPVICSSYRSREKQEQLFQNKVERLTAAGYSPDQARTEAAKTVAVPGTSEHQLGLALDIVDVNHQTLDSSQESTDVQQWLIAHSWEYGFILRYPSEKSEITGIIYEPWHYRYVGKDAAAEIHEAGVCLEEYLEQAARPE